MPSHNYFLIKVPEKHINLIDFALFHFLRFCSMFQMNVDPEDLIPKLPKPKDLQPFPTTQAIVTIS